MEDITGHCTPEVVKKPLYLLIVNRWGVSYGKGITVMKENLWHKESLIQEYTRCYHCGEEKPDASVSLLCSLSEGNLIR